MNIAGRKVAVVLTLVAVVTLVFGSFLRADEQKIRDEFRLAINAYEEGDYKQAKIHFAAVLNLNPSLELAAALRDSATLRYLHQIAQREEIGPDIWRLINLAAQYDRDQLSDSENIKKLIAQLDGDFDARQVAMASLVNAGAFAIPLLVPHLADPNEEDGMRSYAYITINKMGLSALQPLIELLNTNDQLLKKNVCLLLAAQNDVRPIPYLLKIALDKSQLDNTRSIASIAFQKLAGVPVSQAKPLETYFYDEAIRYYADSPIVQEEAYSSYGTIWYWNEEAKNILPSKKPVFTYNEEIAKIRCFDGLKVNPKSDIFTPLLVCLGYSELNEVSDKLMMLNQQYGRGVAEEEKSDIEEAIKSYQELESEVRRANVIGHLVGQKNLFAALEIAQKFNKVGEMVSIINAVTYLSDGSMLPAPGAPRNAASAIIDALSNDNARVRYEAAIGIAKMNPSKPFEGKEKVALTLAAALSETSDINFLVVENDLNLMNKFVNVIRNAGFGAEGAFSGRSGLAKAGVYPIKDVILLDYTLDDEGDINTEQVYRNLKEYAHTVNIPIVFLVPQESVEEFKTKFPGDHPYIQKPVDEAEMIATLRDIIKEGGFDNPFRVSVNDIAIRAAQAISEINPDATQIDLKPSVPTLIAAFNSRLDAVRVAAIKALGNLKEASALDALKGVFKNTENTSIVRITSLRAIGRIDPAAAKDLLEEAIADEDYEIALEGAKALGQRDFDVETINKLIEKSK